MVEREQLLFGEFGDELNREERVAAGLVMDELRERARAVVARTERLRKAGRDLGDFRESGESTICWRAPALRICIERA